LDKNFPERNQADKNVKFGKCLPMANTWQIMGTENQLLKQEALVNLG